ncbi:MAG: nucleoside-diphosphate sugar epimerase/dehydratase [Marinilabilia sp.]
MTIIKHSYLREKLKQLLDNRFLPRWLVLITDILIVGVAFAYVYFLRFNIIDRPVDVPDMLLQLVVALPFFLLSALIFRSHHGIIRHSGMHDAITIFKTHALFSATLFLISFAGSALSARLVIPNSVIILHFFVSVFALLFMRFMVQVIFKKIMGPSTNTRNVLIYGAGDMGSITANVIEKGDNIHYRVVGFIDDNHHLWKKKKAGIPVYSPVEGLGEVASRRKVREVIMAIAEDNISITRKNEVVDMCLSRDLKVKEVPDARSWIGGMLSPNQIREVRIEDLLGRDPIHNRFDMVAGGITGKRVMVTGGAGSIGSEIVRQLVKLQPESIIIIDQAESMLYDVQLEIKKHLDNVRLYVYVADVTNRHKMNEIFARHHPQIIYHAAAYKHVPLMEQQPSEAIRNNIGGTKNIADLAVEYTAEKFVMVSTDKAVNPTNVMGASKRVSEIYINSLSKIRQAKTQFITTRFGNVLGSNGSVIPLFKRQIAAGGPVTVTHKDVVRYFMTIPEACQLVIEAGFMGKGGEIYLFDMGEPVKIYQLAEKMIFLSGFTPHNEIKIIETGLRPGEKLFEELLASKETTLPTEHDKIMIARIRPYDYEQAVKRIVDMLDAIKKESDMELVSRMKDIAPEFRSKNSPYEKLDKLKEIEYYEAGMETGTH